MKRWALLILAALSTAGFIALGVWQLERREWKLALIARVEQRVHAAPVAPPGPSRWSTLSRENAEYLRVTSTGQFLADRDTLVRAVTERGAGYWVLTPFETDEGFIMLVNRGFVAQGQRDRTSHADPNLPAGHTLVTGLVRMTEPKGGFLRTNDPAQDQWYSRDVPAIAQARKLPGVAPYFIDAEASPSATPNPASKEPVPGLTVIAFRNSHLSYAFTWFALALMSAFFGFRLVRSRA